MFRPLEFGMKRCRPLTARPSIEPYENAGAALSVQRVVVSSQEVLARLDLVSRHRACCTPQTVRTVQDEVRVMALAESPRS